MKSVFFFFAVVIGVAAISAVATRHLIDRPQPQVASLHDWLHRQLDLTEEQSVALDRIEAEFAAEEKPVREAFAAANRELAALIGAEAAYTPEVASAVEHVHHLMGELQKLSIKHLFSMASVLDPGQREKLIHYAEMALTEFH
jgi:Spy/CpxP family protein refolding chaperone